MGILSPPKVTITFQICFSSWFFNILFSQVIATNNLNFLVTISRILAMVCRQTPEHQAKNTSSEIIFRDKVRITNPNPGFGPWCGFVIQTCGYHQLLTFAQYLHETLSWILLNILKLAVVYLEASFRKIQKSKDVWMLCIERVRQSVMPSQEVRILLKLCAARQRIIIS